MRLVTDLHIHSPYSRATSSRLSIPYLDRWARIKGIGLVGTGDCTHPRWLADLRENLDDAEPGLFTLKTGLRTAFDLGPALIEELPQPQPGGDADVRFVLTGEISTIYRRDGKTRKVHHLIALPDFRAAALFNTKLERIGNIRSDGRPILGLDSRDLFSLLLEADERSLLIPAHIWTPWFSALGAKSGFESIEECYGELAAYIPAIETGLSSDPPMNWALSSLDRYAIISNSDAHSPDKLGREATIFDMELSYNGLRDAIFLRDAKPGILATVEFFPEEGKYHYDGHRKCGVCLTPQDGGRIGSGDIMCPVCGKALTRGVMGRVMELADRPLNDTGQIPAMQGNRRPYYSLIPLKEILGELLGTGPASKKVNAAYSGLIGKASELPLLMEMSIDRIGKINAHGISTELLAEAIDRMRRGQVSITAGYDGEYGVIRVFPPGENPAKQLRPQGDNLLESAWRSTSEFHCMPQEARKLQLSQRAPARQAQPAQPAAFTFDSEQQAIINYEGNRALIIAAPGTGKTAVLAARIAKLIDCGVAPAAILALSFTVKAAGELRERIKNFTTEFHGGNSHQKLRETPWLINLRDSNAQRGDVLCATFHSFCCSLLREQAQAAGIPAHFEIIGEARRADLLTELCASSQKKISPGTLGRYIEERKRFVLLPGEEKPALIAALLDSWASMLPIPAHIPELDALYGQYRIRLNEQGLLDYDDLIAGTARLLAARQEIRAQCRLRFSHIFVDEYQDINLSQYILLRLLADEGGLTANACPSLWVIGDPHQAIYGFRGSDKRFIDRFMLDYPDAGRFELVRSFRCAQPIISAASRLAGASLRGTARPVDLYRAEYPSDKSEAEGIARAISRLIGGTSFFAKASIAGQDSADQDSAAAEQNSAYSGYEDTAAPGDCAILIRAAPLAEPIIKALSDHGIPYNFCGEQPWWEEEPFKSFLDIIRASSAPEEVFQKEKNDARLSRLVELAEMTGGITPLLDALAVSDSGGIPGYNREGVHIMTIHAAKGLEFDHVFVPGCEEGILPFTLFGEDRPDLIDEERRLLYVAMTRARIGLALSWAHRRSFKGRIIQSQMSPFLNQLEEIIPLVEGKKPMKKSDQLSLFEQPGADQNRTDA